MESNVVKFIVENIYLFFPLGISGIAITLYLYYTGKKEENDVKEELDADYIVLSKLKLNVYVLIYLFIFVMMLIIGALSDFIFPVIIGGAMALIPIILMIPVKNSSKVL